MVKEFYYYLNDWTSVSYIRGARVFYNEESIKALFDLLALRLDAYRTNL